MTDKPIVLTPNEEVTLRRVAFGESPERTLRADDLARLRLLRLVANGKDGPYLTGGGRTYFAALPKPIMAEKAQSRLSADLDRIPKIRGDDA